MIQKEVRSIKVLEERVAFKELMENVFLPLHEVNQKMYENLERRVMDDLAYDMNRYRICTGIVSREEYDPSHHQMAPVCPEDISEPVPKAGELRQEIEEKGRAVLGSVFIQANASEVKRFFQYQDLYTGKILAGGEYELPIRVEPAKRYLSALEHLYHMFMKNGVPWKTVNAPYLFKMADISICSIPEQISDDQEVTALGLDFGAFTPQIHLNMIPVWNIRPLDLESVGFPVPCEDFENYEHTISIQEYGADNAYLAEDIAGIRNVRQSGGKLYITGRTAREKRWKVYMIQNGAAYQIDRFTYPMMVNGKKDSFGGRYMQRMGQPVRTKGELERMIRSFDLEDQISYKDCSLREWGRERQDTYAMNFFLRDEIRSKTGRQMLTLYFEPKSAERWLALDLASYITSEVQEFFPEYQCGGRLL